MDFERYVEDFNRCDARELVERWYADDVVVELAGHLSSSSRASSATTSCS
jgi:hypothetical protein